MTASEAKRQRPPSPGGMRRGVLLAVLVHVALVIALAFGVHWRSSEPAGVEADLVAAVPKAAAPKVETPPPEPKPEPKPEPPPPPPPPPKPAEPPQPTEAEIAAEKAKQEQLKREQEERERRAEEQRKLAEEQRKLAEERKRREAEQEKEKERKLAEEAQRKREQAERDERRQAQLAEERRKAALDRMMAQAGTGAPDSTGTAARSQGPSAGYAGRIVAKVKPNIVFGESVAGNPAAEVEVRAGPDGTIVARRLVRSSGVREWDDAVLRAIDRTGTLPRDVDGRVPSPIIISFKPSD